MDPAILMMLAQIASGAISGAMGGDENELDQLSNYTTGQSNFLNKYLSMLGGLSGSGGGAQDAMGLLQQYLNPESDAYKSFEQPYLNQFNQQTIPMIAEQFAGYGGGMGGGLSSSGFGQALGAAGGNLQASLAQMKSSMGRQSANDLLGQFNQMSQSALGAQPFSYLKKQKSPNFLQSLLSGFSGAANPYAGG